MMQAGLFTALSVVVECIHTRQCVTVSWGIVTTDTAVSQVVFCITLPVQYCTRGIVPGMPEL